MKFFRNPEIRLSLVWHFSLFFGAVLLGFCFPSRAVILMIVFSFLFIGSHYWITWRRYRRLAQLAREIDHMLHSQIPVQFEKYQEGELSILENELSKMTLKLSEQAAALDRKSVV